VAIYMYKSLKLHQEINRSRWKTP